MRQTHQLKHRFVESFPEKLEPETLYVALDFATMSHLCCCGCGHEVITPLSPHDWKMTFDGESITVHPSIGNWAFPCRSHYFIRQNSIQWAGQWSEKQIRQGREQDIINKRGSITAVHVSKPRLPEKQRNTASGFFNWIKSWFAKNV